MYTQQRLRMASPAEQHNYASVAKRLRITNKNEG